MPKLEFTDISKLNIGPGEALLIRVPDDRNIEAIKNFADGLKHELGQHGLSWPIIFTTDKVEFRIVTGPTSGPTRLG